MMRGDGWHAWTRVLLVLGVVLVGSLALAVGPASAATRSPTAIGTPHRTASSWTTALERPREQLQARALVAPHAAFASPQVLVIDNGGDYGNPEPAENARHILERNGYGVVSSSRLPRSLAGFKAIWFIGTSAISSGDQTTLEGFVRSGGGLYLTGERPCCEAMNQSDQAILQHLIGDIFIHVGDGRDVEGTSVYHNRFNPYAVGGVTQVPNSLGTWQPAAPGVLTGIAERNAMAFGEQGAFQLPTAAAWASSELRGGRGNLVVMMDINWLESSWGNLSEAERTVMNIERFFGGAPAHTGRYVALGDSFSAGDGNTPYQPENPSRGCNRSASNAYPDTLAKSLGLSAGNYAFNFVACSGATTKAVQQDQVPELGAQTKLVTLSAGGNDVGFKEVLEACVKFNIWSTRSCGSSGSAPAVVRNAVANTKALKGTLESFYRGIRAAAPNARVFVLGYPNIFPPTPKLSNYCSGLSEESVEWLYKREVELDKVTREAVAAVGLSYVDPNVRGTSYSFVEDSQHQEHSVCSSKPWFYTLLGGIGHASFHPNAEGQRRLAEAFVAAGATKVKVNAALGPPLGALLATPASHAANTASATRAPSTHAAAPARLSSPQRLTGVRIAAEGETSSISGKVTATGGEPLSGVTVYLESPELGYYRSTQTEAKGKYSFSGLTPGTYKLEFYDYGYEAEWFNGKSSEATATAIVLKPGVAKSASATLAPDASISGIVTSSEGTGLAYARVVVTDGEGNEVAAGESSFAGEYTIRDLPAGTYKVEFTGGQYSGTYYETQWYNGAPSVQSAAPVTLTSGQNATGISASLVADGTVSGVVHGASGEPLAGVQVIVRSPTTVAYAYTSESGEYTAYGTPAGTYTVEFYAQGQPYATQWYEGKGRESEATPVIVGAGENVSSIDATMQPDATISGTVTAAGGRTLEGVLVVASERGGENSSYGYTGADGSYAIAALPPGEYTVTFEANGKYFAQQWFQHAASEQAASLLALAPGEARSGVDAALEPTAATVEGRVGDSHGPVSGVNVLVLAGGGATAGRATTNSEGTYVIEGLPEGAYTIEFEAEGTDDVSQYYKGAAAASEAATVTLSATQTFLADATLARGAAISGVVKGAGSGLEGVTVDVLTETGGFVANTTTGQDGTYAVGGLPAGRYKLEFEPAEGSSYVSQYYADASTLASAQLLAVATDETATADAELTAGGSVTGAVTAATGGAPLENVRVLATNSEGNPVANTTTGPEGAYSLAGLPSGSYTVQFEPEDQSYVGQYYAGAQSSEGAKQVAITAGQTTEGISAALQPSASISGSVTGPRGEAIGGVEVSVVSHEGISRTAMSTAGGAYTITGLPAGRYTVHFEPSEAGVVGQFYNGASGAEEAEAVSLEAGQAKEGVNATLAAAASIRGVVTEAGSGTPLAGVEVTATANEGDATASATTDGSGAYTITGLPATAYTVRFDEGARYVSQYFHGSSTAEGAEAVKLEAGATREGVNAELTAGASISGIVKAEGGGPLTGVDVYATAKEGGASASAITGANGEYSVTGLPAGSYTLAFEAPGQNYVKQYYSGVTSVQAATPVKLAAGEAKGAVDAVLADGASISGTVTAAGGSHQALAGIDVYAYQSCSVGGLASTDSEGHYTVEGLPAGSYHVVLNPEGGGLSLDSYPATIALGPGAAHAGVDGALAEQPEGEPAPPFTCEEAPQSAPPEFGRCVKAVAEKENGKTVSHGWFTSSACVTREPAHLGKYEWHAGVAKGGFKTLIKPTTKAMLETVHKLKVTCTGESSAGTITGAKTVGNVTIKLTGCESNATKCTTAGRAEGELETRALEGVLGIERSTIKEGKETRSAALDLYPAGRHGPFLEYTCTGSPTTTVTGSLIGRMPTDKMFSTSTVTYVETSGKQKPEQFEGGEKDVLQTSLGEQTGLKLTSTQTNEEPFEINAFA